MVNYQNSEELMHYGVKGMKWGVHRASKQLAKATTTKERDAAIAKLNKHRGKASAKVEKLEKQHVQLEKDVNRHITKNDTKAAEIKAKAAQVRKKAYGRFTSQDRSEQMLYKANKLDARANDLMARSEKAKAKLAKNEKMTELFKKGLNDIDAAMVDKGRKYLTA